MMNPPALQNVQTRDIHPLLKSLHPIQGKENMATNPVAPNYLAPNGDTDIDGLEVDCAQEPYTIHRERTGEERPVPNDGQDDSR